MKKIIVGMVLIVTLFATSAFAIDITGSIEGDVTQGGSRPDVQLSVGQAFADKYRLYINAERTDEVNLFPNSDKNYRVGISDTLGAITLDTGVGCYKSTPYGFVKLTATIDTAAKK
jgi:hypothetical protein